MQVRLTKLIKKSDIPFLEVAWKEYLELYVCMVVPETVYVTAQLQLSSVQNFMVW